MPTMYDVQINDLLDKVAEELKNDNNIQPPEWAAYVKTGVHKERPPQQKDWWYVRCAAVLRTVRMKGPIGVSKLRTKYGGRKNRGHKPDAFRRGSGNIIRKVLQQLETGGYLKQAEKGVHKGRVATPKGVSILDRSAVTIHASPQKRQQHAEKPVAEATK
ncbi:MAG: 30S ribosomal protein S19e [Candidatus Nanoarchaeia archaeon]